MSATDEYIRKIAEEAERIEEDAEYSAKGHYNAAERWGRIHTGLGAAATVASAVTAAAALKEAAPIVVAVASVVAALMTGVLTFLKPSDHADRHHRAGDGSLVIKNRARILRNVQLAKVNPDEDLLLILQTLSDDRHTVLKSAPLIPNRSFREARDGIKRGESRHRVDKKENRV
jgi:hypothetical protein